MDLKSGLLFETSQNFADLIKKHNLKNLEEQLYNEKLLTIKKLFLDFDFKKFKANTKKREVTKRNYEAMHTLRLNNSSKKDY